MIRKPGVLRLKKIVFALITSVQCLKSYFQVHPIIILIHQPLHSILQCPNTSSLMTKWAIKLDEFNISYQPGTSIKGQVLADFLVKCSWLNNPSADEPETPSVKSADPGSVWVLHMDGASNAQGSGAGMILWSRRLPHRICLEILLRSHE